MDNSTSIVGRTPADGFCVSLGCDLSGPIHTATVRFEKAAKDAGGWKPSAVLRGGNGADDETTRRAVEGDGEEDHLGGGGAEIIGVTDRTMRRWRERLETH